MNLAERFKKEKIAINCETEQEAEKFIDWCYDNGMRFPCDGKHTYFKEYNEETCYECDISCISNNLRLFYANVDYYKQVEYRVIKYKDFFKGETNMIKVKDIAEKYSEYEIDENKLKELLVEPKPKSIWDLKVGDQYFYINSDGAITLSLWRNENYHENRRAAGSCFLTYKEAEFEMERRKVETKLLRLGGTRDMNSLGYGDKHCIVYKHNEKRVIADNWNNYNTSCTIYFKTQKQCENAIKEIGADRIKKYIFHVEEDK